MEPFLLVLLPGVALFLASLLYGLVYYIRFRRPAVRAHQAQLLGIALMLAIPAIWLAYLVAIGRASPIALAGTVMMLGFAAFNVALARSIRVPHDDH